MKERLTIVILVLALLVIGVLAAKACGFAV